MPESLAITRLLNHLFGGLVAALLHAVGIQADPATAISNAFALELLVVVGLIAFFILVLSQVVQWRSYAIWRCIA